MWYDPLTTGEAMGGDGGDSRVISLTRPQAPSRPLRASFDMKPKAMLHVKLARSGRSSLVHLPALGERYTAVASALGGDQ